MCVININSTKAKTVFFGVCPWSIFPLEQYNEISFINASDAEVDTKKKKKMYPLIPDHKPDKRNASWNKRYLILWKN